MLLSFSIENFKSFKETATLSLIARKAEKTLRSALLNPGDALTKSENVLPAAAIYGANAAGKSNFLLALLYMRLAIIESQAKWAAGTGTRYDPNVALAQEEGRFEVVFIAEGVRYRYGFCVNRKVFSEEWLYSYPKGRERLLFRRTTKAELQEPGEQDGNGPHQITSQIEIGAHFSGDRREHDSAFRRTKENSLFLSASAQDNQPESVVVERWFRVGIIPENKLNIYSSIQKSTSYLAEKHSNFKSLLLPLLRAADPCIVDVVIEKPSVDTSIADDVPQKDPGEGYKVFFLIKGEDKDRLIPFQKQSRGLKRLYALAAGLISGLKFGRIVVIDELETSMHAHVASQLLSLFQNPSSNPRGAQLVFTTHETRLLNLQHLRRDQVWFCERDDAGNSTLFSLLEFSPRKDENFEVGYLRGRYGAVPLAGIDPKWLQAINDAEVEIPTEFVDA